MYAVSEKLKQLSELPATDGHTTGHTGWESQRAKDVDAANLEILIFGCGQK